MGLLITIGLMYLAYRLFVKPKVNRIKSTAQRASFAPRAAQKPAVNPRGLPRYSGQRAQASGPGQISGYEPRTIDTTRFQNSNLIFGSPGAGLSAAGFSKAATQMGQDGELRFAKALVKAELIDRVATFWSVSLPAEVSRRVARGATMAEDAKFNTDIDVVVFTGTVIYLVDVKNYRSGGITYYTSRDSSVLISLDDATHEMVGEEKHPSRNMIMALDRFKKMFPNKNVQARIVFVPRDEGEATLRGATWPGGIPAVRLTDFLAELTKVCHPKERVQAVLPRETQVLSAIRSLLR